MNKKQKEIQQLFLDQEKEVLKKLEANYQDALSEINSKIELLLARQDADMQHVIYQVEYQKALKSQVSTILEQLHNNEFETVSEYLAVSYEDGFIGAMYDLQGQGIPLIIPIDQEQVVAAIQHETKLSESLYMALGKDTKDLSKKIAGEISRGISTGSMYSEIARNIAAWGRIPQNNAMRIARTEAHRIQNKASMDACLKAKANGADVVKEWSAALDKKTRPSHQKLDGQIRELDEEFEVNGYTAMQPGDFGRPEEDINCRCRVNQRARWNLGSDYTKWSADAPIEIADDGTSQLAYIKSKNYKDFKEQYKTASETFLNQLKISFPEDVFKIKGFTEEVKNEVDTAMKKLNNEYEIRLNSIVLEPGKKGDVFMTGYHDGIVDMAVNENADFEKIIKRIKKKYNDGYLAGKSLEDYVAHEMAHCMLYQDCKTDTEYRAKFQQIESLYTNLKGISGYADKSESGNEALAEAFVRVRNGEKVSPIAKVLVNTYFGKWKK